MMPPELKELFMRFIELGALLSHQDDFDTDDPRELAEQKLILREMQQVHNEMKTFPEMARAIAAIEAEFGPLFNSDH
jgi:hypothetical protein